MHFPYDQLSNKLEGMNLDASNLQAPPVMGYQSQINNGLSPASPNVFVSNNLTNGSNVTSDVAANQNTSQTTNQDANQTVNSELNKSNLEALQSEPLKQENKPSEEMKSNLPNYQQFIPNYGPPISNLQQHQQQQTPPPAPTLYNPNLSHQVSSPNLNPPNTSTIPTYQPMPNLHYQQLPTSNQSQQFSNYSPATQIAGYPPHGPPQSQFNPHSIYSPPINSQQYMQHNPPAPVSTSNAQQEQQFMYRNLPQQQTAPVHTAPVHTSPPVAQPPRDVSTPPVQSGPPQSNLPAAGPPSSLPPQQVHLPAQSVSSPTSQHQQQPNYSFTTPLNLPGMPPLNVRLDSSKIPLNNLDTIIGNSNTQ